MERLKRKLHSFGIFLPAFVVMVLVLESLNGYEAPAYDIPAAEAEAAEAGLEKADKTKPKQKIKAPRLDPAARPVQKRKVPAGTAAPLAKADESGEYADGTYTGSAQGFGGPVTVKVTITGGKIVSVQIVSAPGEDAGFLNKARS